MNGYHGLGGVIFFSVNKTWQPTKSHFKFNFEEKTLPKGSYFLNSNFGDARGRLNAYMKPVPAELNNFATIILF